MAASLALHHHGKSRVRVGRTWREGNVHHFVEWTVEVLIESDMEHAFLHGSNTDMTPTDTVKNTARRIPIHLSSSIALFVAPMLTQPNWARVPLLAASRQDEEPDPCRWRLVAISLGPSPCHRASPFPGWGLFDY